MVAWSWQLLRGSCSSGQLLALAAQEKAEPVIVKLDPANRTKLIMAAVAFTLIGFSLLSLIVMLGRRAKRLARESHGKTHVDADQWARKPLARPDSQESPPRER